MKTVIATQKPSYEEWLASIRAERIKILSSPHFNRVKITEAIRHYNIGVKASSERAANPAEYRRKYAMTKIWLAAEVLPEYPISVAQSYISHWNKGSRMTALSPSRILLLAKVLKCSVSDLFESIS